MNCISVIGDLIQSRDIKDRKQVQQRILNVFEKINQKYENIILSKLTLTLGDEFQVILKPHRDIMKLLDDLEGQLKLPFRLGIGYGSLLTTINPELSIGADGETFWHAREAIEYIHDKDWNGRSRVRIQGFGKERDELLNALLATTDALKYQWTDLQRETFEALLEQDLYQSVFDQKSFAKRLKISSSSLTKRLNAGNIKLYIHARNRLGRTIEAWHAETQ